MTSSTIDPKFKFKKADDLNKVEEIFQLCGTQWGGPLTPKEFGKVFTNSIKNFKDSGNKVMPYYVEDSTNGKLVACTIVKFIKALYKPADKSSLISSVPDPQSFGVKNVTALHVSFVFTSKEYRKQGLAEFCVSKAIATTEEEIIADNVNDSVDSHAENFKKMTLDDPTGTVDRGLANYYLGKQYIWVLYSGVNTYYERFGFKSYPLDYYKIPVTSVTEGQDELLNHLLQDEQHLRQTQPETKSYQVGKRLRLLDWENKNDQSLIQLIFQAKELGLLSEMSKLVFHTELQSSHRSSSSLTNLNSILGMKPIGSGTGLSSIAEAASAANSGKGFGLVLALGLALGMALGLGPGLSASLHPNDQSGSRRKSSAFNQTVSKFAIKPSFDNYKEKILASLEIGAFCNGGKEYSIQGAVLTNDLQQRSYYILWTILKGEFFITGMGEVPYEGLSQGTSRRRGSSFTGLNDLGGFNFQDLDLLVCAAVQNAKQRGSQFENVYVATTDLPSDIPDEVLHDFFLNYLPFSSYASDEHKERKQEQRNKGEEKNGIELIVNGADAVGVLPMIRQFGSTLKEFDLDWLENGMWCWG